MAKDKRRCHDFGIAALDVLSLGKKVLSIKLLRGEGEIGQSH
jgi:hypothetical protein